MSTRNSALIWFGKFLIVLHARVNNRRREYPTVKMSPESNVTSDHSHVMHVVIFVSFIFRALSS